MRAVITRLQRRFEFAWTFIWASATRVAMLLGSLLGTVLIYRTLTERTPDMGEAAHFAVAMAAIRMLTNSIGGTSDLVVLRHLPVLVRTDSKAASEVVWAAMLLRASSLGLMTILALATQSWFARSFLGGEQAQPLVLLILAAAAGELLLRSALSVFQATERFVPFVAFEASFQAARLVAVLALYLADLLTVANILMSYALSGGVVWILAVQRVPPALRSWRIPPRAVLRDNATFFLWTIAGYLLVASTERADVFLLSHFRADQVGLYGGVLALAVIPDFVGGLLATVLYPRVVRLQEEGGTAAFQRRMLLVMVPPAVLGMLVLTAIADQLVALVLGPRFVAVADAFVVLAAASTFWLVVTPVPAALISLNAPRISTGLCVVQLVLMVGSAFLLVPPYGAWGAAVAVAISRSLIAIAIALIGRRRITATVAA